MTTKTDEIKVQFCPDCRRRISDCFCYDDGEEDEFCHYCWGEGWGIVGVNWDCDDPINGPYYGELEPCPCCGGSGLVEDATFW
jgi:hypothetical protein